MYTVCLFGIYDPNYSRNRVLVQGFRENNWNVVNCRVDPEKYKGFSKYGELIRNWRILKDSFKKDNIKPDIILVAFPGHTVVWLARLLCPGRKIYFDAFLSRFDSNVHDRKLYGKFSARGLADWILDWSSCAMSDMVLLDTQQHIDYFSKKFFVNKKKMMRVPVSTDTSNFFPREKDNHPGKFVVYFQGMFITLQGIKYIIEAADILQKHKDIIFQIVGSGQQYREIQEMVREKKLSNIFLLGIQPLTSLPEHIRKADICLGIFGETDKTERVIPNKVYEYVAMKKAVITSDTPAIREFFVNEKDMLLCKRADGKSLAEAIMRLKNDPELVSNLATNSYNYFDKNMRPGIIVSHFLKSI